MTKMTKTRKAVKKNSLGFLYSLEKRGIVLGLERVKKLLSKSGNPEKNLKVIHVAGTNGKGSVCAMLSSILQESGYKVGMYTSPHIYDFRERITINSKKIAENELSALAEKFKPLIKTTKPTFFEAVTAIAFDYFKSKNVDFVIAEVGLGGRLDATNVVNPLVSVITNIAIEHTDYLGSTIESIAGEKAGIIKNNGIVVTGAKGKALKVIKNVCREKKAKLIIANKNKNIKTNMLGDFQKSNAAIAVAVVGALNKCYKIKTNKTTINKALQNVKWPARVEFKRKDLLIDCAHNPAGMLVLSGFIRQIKKQKQFKKIILIIGILKDKDYKTMLSMIIPLADMVIATEPDSERKLDAEALAKEIKVYNKNVIALKNPKKALGYAEKIKEKCDLILVTGSCYLPGRLS